MLTALTDGDGYTYVVFLAGAFEFGFGPAAGLEQGKAFHVGVFGRIVSCEFRLASHRPNQPVAAIPAQPSPFTQEGP